jgi:hypothetical protein
MTRTWTNGARGPPGCSNRPASRSGGTSAGTRPEVSGRVTYLPVYEDDGGFLGYFGLGASPYFLARPDVAIPAGDGYINGWGVRTAIDF